MQPSNMWALHPNDLFNHRPNFLAEIEIQPGSAQTIIKERVQAFRQAHRTTLSSRPKCWRHQSDRYTYFYSLTISVHKTGEQIQFALSCSVFRHVHICVRFLWRRCTHTICLVEEQVCPFEEEQFAQESRRLVRLAVVKVIATCAAEKWFASVFSCEVLTHQQGCVWNVPNHRPCTASPHHSCLEHVLLKITVY